MITVSSWWLTKITDKKLNRKVRCRRLFALALKVVMEMDANGDLIMNVLNERMISKYQDSKYRSLENIIMININDTLCIFASWQNRSVPRVCFRGVFLRG